MGEIRSYAFSGSGIEKIRLPSTLRNLCFGSLSESKKLRTVWADNPREIEIKQWVWKDAIILPATLVMLEDVSFSSLRAARRRDSGRDQEDRKLLVFGLGHRERHDPGERQGHYQRAFCGCKKFRPVTFAEGSRLEEFEQACSRSPGSRTYVPPRLRKVGSYVFYKCKQLRARVSEDSSRSLRRPYSRSQGWRT